MNKQSNNGTPTFDNSHASHHHLEGKYDHAITQKGSYEGHSFQTWTNVDRNGNVNDSGFGNYGKKRS